MFRYSCWCCRSLAQNIVQLWCGLLAELVAVFQGEMAVKGVWQERTERLLWQNYGVAVGSALTGAVL